MTAPIRIWPLDNDAQVRERHAMIERRLDELGEEKVRELHGHGLPSHWDVIVARWLKGDRLEPETPDWPPRGSAVGLPDGTKRHGSTGQLWETRNGRWVRIDGDDQRR